MYCLILPSPLITLDSERLPSSFEKVTLIGVCSYGPDATWDRSYFLWMSLKRKGTCYWLSQYMLGLYDALFP